MLCNALKISEYEAYWLTNFLLINIWACQKKLILVIILSFEEVYATYKSKQTSMYDSNFAVNIIVAWKVRKQDYRPVDILLGI